MEWEDLLSEQDRAVLKKGRFARRMGFGERPAVLCIDCQTYMVGDKDEAQEKSMERFPASCGPVGWRALEHTARLLTAARRKGLPVFYTRFVLSPDGRDAGVYALKRDLLTGPNWALQDTPGSEISPLVAPEPTDIVLQKNKPSAFFGTPLLGLLISRKVDTLLICGGATSNCVRATVFDAASYNFRPIVVEECVFDRIEISHKTSLFDMDRQFADVVRLEAVLAYLEELG
jgi:nicotinamidase-related amidase